MRIFSNEKSEIAAHYRDLNSDVLLSRISSGKVSKKAVGIATEELKQRGLEQHRIDNALRSWKAKEGDSVLVRVFGVLMLVAILASAGGIRGWMEKLRGLTSRTENQRSVPTDAAILRAPRTSTTMDGKRNADLPGFSDGSAAGVQIGRVPSQNVTGNETAIRALAKIVNAAPPAPQSFKPTIQQPYRPMDSGTPNSHLVESLSLVPQGSPHPAGDDRTSTPALNGNDRLDESKEEAKPPK
jgi:hypothetical protein